MGEFTTANDVIINKFTINNKVTVTSNNISAIEGLVVDNTARIIINNESFDLSAAQLASGAGVEVDAQVEVLAGETAKVEIVLNTRRNITGDFQYEVGLIDIVSADDTSVEYANEKKVTGTKVSLKAGDFTVTSLNASAGNDTISTDELGQEIGRFSVRAKNDDMKLTTLTGELNSGALLTGADTLEDVIGQSIELYVEGQTGSISASLTMSGDNFELRDMDYVITKNTTVRFVLVADFGDVKDYVDANNTIKLNITVTAEDTNSASIVDTKTLDTYKFTKAKPVVSLTNGSNSKVFTIGLDNSKNDDVTLSEIALYIEGSQSGYTGVACLSNDELTAICTAPGVVATGTVINGTSTTFTINSSEGVLGVKEYYLILPAVSNENDVRVVVDTITIVEGGATFHYGNIEATYKNY